jgi:hypothetical protein
MPFSIAAVAARTFSIQDQAVAEHLLLWSRALRHLMLGLHWLGSHACILQEDTVNMAATAGSCMGQQ